MSTDLGQNGEMLVLDQCSPVRGQPSFFQVREHEEQVNAASKEVWRLNCLNQEVNVIQTMSKL